MQPLSSARRLVSRGVFLAILAAPAAAAGLEEKPAQDRQAANRSVALVPDSGRTRFHFETEQIQGTIQTDGAYHGISRLVDRRTGKPLIASGLSALNLYRLHGVNHGMGQPRKMERTVKVFPDAVEVTWPATDSHKALLTARYEVRAPDAVDLTLTVRCQGTYPGYEVFLPNYFDKGLRPYVYLQPRFGTKGREPELVVPTVNDVFRNTVLVFPRDAHAARRCLDGRWDRIEEGAVTVQFCPVRRYGHCLAFLADAGKQTAVVLMAHPRHCYAISTRYHADDEADRFTPYSAFDFSLFGDDLVPGDERTVKVRLAVIALDGDLTRPLKLYQTFLAETEKPLRAPRKGAAKGE